MKITKEKGELVLKIPLWQKSYDAMDNLIGDVPNLVGIIAKDEYSISSLNELGYKDDIQEGGPIIILDSKEEVRAECKKLGLDVWEHPVCAYCGDVIHGCYTLGKKGEKCMSCDNKKQYENTKKTKTIKERFS